MLNQPPQLGDLSGLEPMPENQGAIAPDLFPAMPYASFPVSPDKVPTSVYTRSLSLTPKETEDLLRACNTFKIQTLAHSKGRKLAQERNYAYFTGQFFGDDLLPLPSTDGSDRDANSNRPQVFIPITAEQILQIYAYLRIHIFPNDEDYFRVVAKKEAYAVYEDDLTEAFKYIFKKNKISEQLGRCLLNTLWSGQFVAFPRFELPKGWEWIPPSPENPDYTLKPKDLEPRLIVEEVNPIHLYLDPLTSTNPRWMTLGYKKMQQVLDSPFTIESTKAEIKNKGGKTQPLTSQYQEGLPISVYNQQNTNYIDYEKWVMYDTFYFPYIELDGKMYYNITVVMIENQLISECRPNVAFEDSQLVQTPWRYQTESNYGFGPADDMQNLQIIINMLYNYMLESLSRNGNIWAVAEGVDLKNLFGGVARILVTPQNMPVNQAVMNIPSSHEDLVVAQNLIGVLKGEAVNIGGSQDPFQGSSNLDFKKTATEINVLQANAVSRNQEAVEHIGYTGVGPVLEKLATLAAHLYQGPITVRIDNPKAAPIIPGEQPGPQDIQAAQAEQMAAAGQPVAPPQGPFFREIDLGVWHSGEFCIELSGVNSSQSKSAEAQLLMQLIEMVATNPEGAIMAEPIMEKLAVLNGLKEFPEVFGAFKDRYNQMKALQEQAAMMQQQAQMMAQHQGQAATAAQANPPAA